MSYTPEEITEILEAYFDSIAHRQYVGSRYVPIFGRVGESSCDWDNTGDYEPLTIVLYQGNSYTSRQFVPAGADIGNTDYWVLTGNFNAQVEQYRLRLLAVENALPIADFDSTDTVKKAIDNVADGLTAETAARISQDALRVISFDTVATMAASDQLSADMVCHTEGFHASNDEGAAWYAIKSAGTANGMDVIALDSGLFAHLIVDGSYVTPEMFGAYGDDSHDDYDVLEYLLSHYKNSVKGNGLYVISDTLHVGSYSNVMLNKVTYNGTGYAFDLSGYYTELTMNVFRSDAGGVYNVTPTTSATNMTLKCLDSYSAKKCLNVDATSGTVTGITVSGKYRVTGECAAKVFINTPAATGVFATDIRFMNCVLGTGGSYRAIETNSLASGHEIQVVFDNCNPENTTGFLLEGYTSAFTLVNSRCNEIFGKNDWLHVDVAQTTNNIVIGINQGYLNFERIQNANTKIIVNNCYNLNYHGFEYSDGVLYDAEYFIPTQNCMGYGPSTYGSDNQDVTIAPIDKTIPNYLRCENTSQINLNLPNKYYGRFKINTVTIKVVSGPVKVNLIKDDLSIADTFTLNDTGDYICYIWFGTSTNALGYLKLN